jgi:hypothetical protein
MHLSAPRYCDRPFPAYRYVPGRFPHPTAHPDGHSYIPPGRPHPKAAFYPPQQWRQSEEYLYGCDLYNHGYWWEAHEAWEGLWQVCDKQGVQGHYLQALIQVSACHMKLHEGKLDGVRSLRASSRGHMDFVLSRPRPGGRFMGLDVAAWWAAVESYYRPRDGSSPLAHDAATYPYVGLKD